jgi:phosphate starvation-inducible PhoH-like protein
MFFLKRMQSVGVRVSLSSSVAKFYHDELRSSRPMILATGPAGTGKTMHACRYAVESLREGSISKLVVTRPLVSVEDEQLGFLPGDMESKMAPWMTPIWDHLRDFSDVHELNRYLRNEQIEIAPMGMMRGRTLNGCLLLGDEMQNSTMNQIKMLLTRVGRSSRVVLTGDLDQCDLKVDTNGLQDLMDRLLSLPEQEFASVVQFDEESVERSDFVKELMKIYA